MPAIDQMGNPANSPSAPASNYAAITTSDSNDLPFLTRYVYVGGAGDVTAVTQAGNAVVFKAVPAGAILPIRARRINQTGTTATNLVALW